MRLDRLGDQADDVCRAAHPRKLDEPPAVANLALERADRLEREPALADAGRPDERHETVLTQQVDDVGHFSLAAYERGRRDGQVAAAARFNRHGGDRRVLGQDRCLQPAKLRPRLEARLLREDPSCLLERLECVRLAAAPVERQHQLPPQPLAHGILLEGGMQGGHNLPMLAKRQRCLELLLERVNAQPLESPCLGVEPRHVSETLQRCTSPQLQRARD